VLAQPTHPGRRLVTSQRRTIFLTGATGFLGRYLLRELRRAGRRVAFLARPSRTVPAEERAGPDPPVELTGDLTRPHLGLSPSGRAWLAANCGAVLHAAACVHFRPTADGEPRATNVEGARRLADLCSALGVRDLHFVSTAFVCGDRAGTVREDDLERGQGFHNAYERSKFEAERLLRADPRLRLTVYRPSVIVGDSRTGHTTAFHGLYRLLELGDRLATPSGHGRRSLPLKLPFRGDEAQDLVPVDWVARAVVRLVGLPEAHGRTYHMTAADPVPLWAVKDVAAAALRIDGVRWSGPDAPGPSGDRERLFLEAIADYRPYLSGAPAFDRRNLLAALPDLPPPVMTGALLARLVRFAAAHRWGRTPRRRGAAGPDCAHYFAVFFPQQADRSPLARAVGLDLTAAFAIAGPGGGEWSCRWVAGELAGVRRGLDTDAAVLYRTDSATFDAVVRGRLSPQEAFCDRRIDVAGDVERGLMLAQLFAVFVRDHPYTAPERREATDAVPQPG
jgi:nucleoside-diphosphate-sugar epimerase